MRDADRGVLAFAAAHHLVLAEQVARLLGTDADVARQRLAGLQLAGLIRRARLPAVDPGGYQITSAGLAAIASGLAPPRLDPGRYRHDIGAGWLWLAATKGGNFGPVEQVLTEREMRAATRDQPPPSSRPSHRRPNQTQPNQPIRASVHAKAGLTPLPPPGCITQTCFSSPRPVASRLSSSSPSPAPNVLAPS